MAYRVFRVVLADFDRRLFLFQFIWRDIGHRLDLPLDAGVGVARLVLSKPISGSDFI
jgi:hypothetical protein